MSALEKIWAKIKDRPYRSDITMNELHSFMLNVGFVLASQSSSHRKYKHEQAGCDIVIPCHDPRREVLPVYVKKVYELVVDNNLLG